jgi:hypothetical protein
MYWIKKRLEQRDEIRQRREKIASATEPIWASLCEAVKDSIAAFFKATPYGRFEQDGENHHVYWVRYVEDSPNHNAEKKKVVLTLNAREGTITATYDQVDYESRSLILGLKGDRVCLQNESEILQSSDAAAYFLDPFLFPDLAETSIPRESVYAKGGVKHI